MTGFPITGIDAKQFGIADELVHNSASYEEELDDILFAMEFPIPNFDTIGDRGRQNPWRDQIAKRIKSEEKQYLAEVTERHRKKMDNLIHEEFMEPKDRVPSLVADSDFKYKQLLRQYNKRFSEGEKAGYLKAEKEDLVYQNYYNYVLSYVKGHSGHDYPRDPRTLLTKNHQAIDRLFFPSTLEEITENLRKEAAEGSTFAALCLDKMAANSTLSMKLALQMVREARNLDFKGALKNEINVALNKIQDKEFDLGVSEVLFKPA